MYVISKRHSGARRGRKDERLVQNLDRLRDRDCVATDPTHASSRENRTPSAWKPRCADRAPLPVMLALGSSPSGRPVLRSSRRRAEQNTCDYTARCSRQRNASAHPPSTSLGKLAGSHCNGFRASIQRRVRETLTRFVKQHFITSRFLLSEASRPNQATTYHGEPGEEFSSGNRVQFGGV